MKHVFALIICAKICSGLGYEFYAEDRYGCICAEHVDSLSLISDFSVKFIKKIKEVDPPDDTRVERKYEKEKD